MDITDVVSLGYIDKIEKTLNNLNDIILDLIELTRLKEGVLKILKVCFNELYAYNIDMLKNLPGFHRIKFFFQNFLHEDFYTDNRYLNTIFLNMLENGIKYSTDERDSHITISIRNYRGGISIKFEDNGIGIPSSLENKVFEMFFRATEKSTGNGLGLYLVKNAVEKLGGSVEVKSKLNEGSSFYVYIPNHQIKLNQGATQSMIL